MYDEDDMKSIIKNYKFDINEYENLYNDTLDLKPGDLYHNHNTNKVSIYDGNSFVAIDTSDSLNHNPHDLDKIEELELIIDIQKDIIDKIKNKPIKTITSSQEDIIKIFHGLMDGKI